jgi:CYTH domain-containing protein
MGKEIERKFLIDIKKWQSLSKPEGQLLRQGYLSTDPAKTIRVRLAGQKGFLTIKGSTTGATRPEYEYEIPAGEAVELLDNFAGSELSKIRYNVTLGSKVWEVDEFLGLNAGLFLAEVELECEDEAFEQPEWVTTEVTDDARYYNANLTKTPYKHWS